MSEEHATEVDVLIVGAGPTGLMMACQLANHHISFRIIDKNETSLKSSGALIVHARSLEIFEQMGIADEMIKSGIVATNVNIAFNGKKIASAAIKDIGTNQSQFPFLLMLEQSITEKLLLKFINDQGHYAERGVRFQRLMQYNDGITSFLVLPSGVEQSLTSKYVFASDGAGSTIRNLLNIPFNGKTFPESIFIMDCKASTDLPQNEICFALTYSTITGFFPLPGQRWRIDGSLPREGGKAVSKNMEEIEKYFSDLTKPEFALQSCEWFSVTHAHQKYAGSIRIQNCFLAGDAAHINTPVGAQGMNTGLQDAFNLAWKMAFVIHHKAKPGLLDTYSSERLGISRGFARYADSVFRFVCSEKNIIKFLRWIFLNIFFKAIFPIMEKNRLFRKMFFRSISQIGIHYRHSTLSYRNRSGFFLISSPEAGDRLPYFELLYKGEMKNIYELLETTGFSLLVFINDLPEEIRKIAEEYKLSLILITKSLETKIIYKRFGIKYSGYYLIRPDHHIALRSANLKTYILNKYCRQFLNVGMM
jgi:2-polyprenyl-6-methoxyphenol hydroxylase-like FAD-dependent oxidoreductase